MPLEDYFNNLQKGALFSQNKNNSATTLDFALASDKKSLFVVCGFQQDAIKPYAFVEIIYENNIFVHINRGTFFDEQGAYKYFTLAQGREWSGGEVFDDLC